MSKNFIFPRNIYTTLLDSVFMPNFLNAYSHPDKYAINIPSEKIIADKKVDKKGIQRYKDIINSGNETKAIVVVKHPEKEYYAVLDGHHRFWAQKELGISTIKSAVIEDYLGLGFYLTKKGLFQPDPIITKYIRTPLKEFKKYMTEFIKNPEKMIQNNKMKKDLEIEESLQ